jgi:hypothetical protein
MHCNVEYRDGILTDSSIKELEGRSNYNIQHVISDVPGHLWAEESQALVMREICKPTLMTAMVSLCDA